jgi:hypothetical protein
VVRARFLVPEPHPPRLTRSVDALGARSFERRAHDVGNLVVVDLHDDDDAAVPERFLVEEQLVVREPGGEVLLHRMAHGRAACGEERGAQDAGRDDRADAGNREARDRGADRQSDRGPRGAAGDGADGGPHARLLAFVGRHGGRNLALGHARSQYVDGVVGDAGPAQALDAAGGGVSRGEDSGHSFHGFLRSRERCMARASERR